MFDRTERGLLARWWWTVDRPLLGVLGLLALSGLIMVFASSPPVAVRLGLPSWHFVTRHLVYLAPAALLLIGCSLLSPRGVYRAAIGLLAFSLLMLAATLIIGVGDQWLDPLDLLRRLCSPARRVREARAHRGRRRLARARARFRQCLARVLGLGLLVMALLLAQPDVGMALMVGTVTGVQLFIAGLPWLLVLGALVLSMLILWQAYSWFPHVAARIDRFIDPASGDHYQVGLALKAVKSAAWFGSGPGEGRLKNQIPDAHSDFVFAVAAEEFGLIACLILIGLFSFVMLRGLKRTELVADRFALIAGAGLLAHFGLQAMVNLGVNLSVLPATGMTLPFISYGGSALCAMAIGMGMFLALTRRRLGHGVPPLGASP